MPHNQCIAHSNLLISKYGAVKQKWLQILFLLRILFFVVLFIKFQFNCLQCGGQHPAFLGRTSFADTFLARRNVQSAFHSWRQQQVPGNFQRRD